MRQGASGGISNAVCSTAGSGTGGTGLAGVYDLRHNNVGFELSQPLGGKWQLRYAYRSRDQENEYGLRYRLHDFLTVEYAMDRHNGWLRFIGYF